MTQTQTQTRTQDRTQAAAAQTPLERYAAGLARLDAAVRAGCDKCGGEVERIDDLGGTLVCCTEPGCYWCKSVGAN